MTHSEIYRPRVVIFDDFHDSIYRDLAQEGANLAGWDSHAFDDPKLALDNFDSESSALITALGTKGMVSFFARAHPAHASARSSGVQLLFIHAAGAAPSIAWPTS